MFKGNDKCLVSEGSGKEIQGRRGTSECRGGVKRFLGKRVMGREQRAEMRRFTGGDACTLHVRGGRDRRSVAGANSVDSQVTKIKGCKAPSMFGCIASRWKENMQFDFRILSRASCVQEEIGY